MERDLLFSEVEREQRVIKKGDFLEMRMTLSEPSEFQI